jgi:hypothetical protein
MKFRLTLAEVSGALADLGVWLPLVRARIAAGAGLHFVLRGARSWRRVALSGVAP